MPKQPPRKISFPDRPKLTSLEEAKRTLRDSMGPLEQLSFWWLRANWRAVAPVVFRQLIGNVWAGKITTGAAIALAAVWQACGLGVFEDGVCGPVKDYAVYAVTVLLLLSGNPLALARLLPEALVAAAKKDEEKK